MNMRTEAKILALVALLVLPGMVLAGSGNKSGEGRGQHHGDMQKMKEGHVMCPMYIQGAEVKVENQDQGVTIVITSQDKAVVKEIQQKAASCLELRAKKAAAGDETAICPVMGTKILKNKAVATREYNGKTYYLCCQGCVSAWDKDPAKYAK
ncbi:YHS domain-containing protein [candidate division FCPU426 bacterium]|nr:YHS domain-containing protein [candidate division FCPU426 bacterium]